MATFGFVHNCHQCGSDVHYDGDWDVGSTSALCRDCAADPETLSEWLAGSSDPDIEPYDDGDYVDFSERLIDRETT